jgi:hypothetical protein
MTPPTDDDAIAAVRWHVRKLESFSQGRAAGAYKGDLEAFRLALARLEASRWRDIAEAPKDGTYILGNKRFLDAGWSPRVMRWEEGQWLTDPGDWVQQPTLWQPLPCPPSTTSERE